MRRFNRMVVSFAAALALATPTLAYAQHGGHGGGGGGHVGGGGGRVSSGARAPSVAPVGSVGTATAAPNAGRNQTGQPTIGTAVPRTPGTGGGFGGSPLFFPGGFGYGYGLGFGYSPFYGSAAFGLGFGGPFYDPFFYDPLNPFGYGYFGFGYPGYGYGYPMGYGASMGYGAYGAPGYGYAGAVDPNAVDPNAYANANDGQYRRGMPPPVSHATGSIRLKVSPDTAKVYVDGTLAGTASEFDGLVGHHLELEVGTHELELRADGHETFHDTITVEAGKTFTERASLKKSK
jgi:hypothetical protein